MQILNFNNLKPKPFFRPETIYQCCHFDHGRLQITNESPYKYDTTDRTASNDSRDTLLLAPETDLLKINDVESIPFIDEFYCLVTLVDLLIDGAAGIKSCIVKSEKPVGALKFIWNSCQISVKTKVKLFLAALINLALWYCEYWSRNKNNLAYLGSIFHNLMRRILGINLLTVKNGRLSNEKPYRNSVETF